MVLEEAIALFISLVCFLFLGGCAKVMANINIGSDIAFLAWASGMFFGVMSISWGIHFLELL